MNSPAYSKSSEPTRESSAALRGEYLGRAARLKRYFIMKLKADWSIKDYGYKPFEEAVVIPVDDLLELVKKLKDDNDIIYLLHPTEASDQMAIRTSEINDIRVEVHGHGGAHVLDAAMSNVEEILNNYMSVTEYPNKYVFKYV